MDYKVYKMNCLNETDYATPIDGFIFFSTLEERSWNVYGCLQKNNRLPQQILLLKLSEDYQSVRNAQKKYGKQELKVSNIAVDLNTNLKSLLKDVDTYIKEKTIIGVDISVIPTPIFARILHFLFKKHQDKKIIIYYTEPAHYNLDNLFEFNGLDGEIDIKAIPGFEGRTAKENEHDRIVFYILGFEMNYLSKLIPQETNPSEIVPINGFPSYFPKYKDISLINNNVNYHEEDIQVVYAEANNPFQVFNKLNYLKSRFSDYCIDVIPTGSKPMALGACLFALEECNNDVRILFPFPSIYRNQSSIGKGVIWEYIIE